MPGFSSSSEAASPGSGSSVVHSTASGNWLSLDQTLKKLEGVDDDHPVSRDGVPNDLGRFRLIREVGRGRFGLVFEAVDRKLDRIVAIKVARPEVIDHEELRGRFAREAELASRLDHPGLVAVHEVGECTDEHGRGWFFIVMAFIEGLTLEEWLRKRERTNAGPFPPRKAVRLVRQMAEAIAHGHARGIVHRDLKPGNIGVDGDPQQEDVEDPRLRVFDFGLSCPLELSLRETRSSAAIGTPLYMAPEQLRGVDVGPAADVYSLGTMLYELLTGRPPFYSETAPEVLHKLWHDDPADPAHANPEVDKRLASVVLKALAKRPEDRYEDACQLSADLANWLDNLPTTARPPGVLERFRLWCERPGRIREAGAVVAVQHMVLPTWSVVGVIGLGAEAFSEASAQETLGVFLPRGTWLLHVLFVYVGYRMWSGRPNRWWVAAAFAAAFLLVPWYLAHGLKWLPAPTAWHVEHPTESWLIFWLLSLTAGIDLVALAIATRSARRARLDAV